MFKFNATCGFGHDHNAERCPYQHIHDEIERLASERNQARSNLVSARAAVRHWMTRFGGFAEVIADGYLDDWFSEEIKSERIQSEGVDPASLASG